MHNMSERPFDARSNDSNFQIVTDCDVSFPSKLAGWFGFIDSRIQPRAFLQSIVDINRWSNRSKHIDISIRKESSLI